MATGIVMMLYHMREKLETIITFFTIGQNSYYKLYLFCNYQHL